MEFISFGLLQFMLRNIRLIEWMNFVHYWLNRYIVIAVKKLEGSYIIK